MKALFLAGGMGTRLRSLTENLPKPMVPKMGKPLLERSMLKFKDCGITEIILSTCYKSQMIEEYYVDILSDISIRDMIKFHKVKRAAVTIAVTQVENYSAYGVIEYNDNLYVKTLLLALIVLLVLILLLAVIVG